MNIVTLSGNLTRDPEMRVTTAGRPVCEAAIAINEKWTREDGSKGERTDFVDLVIWGASGEAFTRYQKKGAKVILTGKLRQETWDDKATGRKRSRIRVEVTQWEMAGKAPDDGEPPRMAPATAHHGPPRATAPKPVNAPEDDVPF